jgi:putative spermidine/putrescine transport system permease protein
MRFGKRVMAGLPFAPALFITAFPLAAGIVCSLKEGGAYRLLFASPFFKSSVLFSVSVACVASCLAVFAGAFFTFLFCARNSTGLLARAFVLMPYLAAAAITANVFGDSGIVAHILKLVYPPLGALGIRYHPYGLGVIIALLYKQLPFVFLCLLPYFHDLRKRFWDETSVLGAGAFTVFFRVLVPGAIRPIAGIFIIIFQFTLFNYEAFAFLGPSSPKGLGELLAMYYYSANETEKKLAMTLCLTEFAVSVILARAFGFVLSRRGEE